MKVTDFDVIAIGIQVSPLKIVMTNISVGYVLNSLADFGSVISVGGNCVPTVYRDPSVAPC